MTSSVQTAAPFQIPRDDTSKATRRVSYAMSGVLVLFLIIDFAMKLIAHPMVIESSGQLGYPADPEFAQMLGLILALCTVLYVVPQTSVLGAILLTGYLGGAVATHLRMGNPLFTHTLFGVYLGILAWGSLYLRDARIRALFPFNR
jgi:hypothetical protein